MHTAALPDPASSKTMPCGRYPAGGFIIITALLILIVLTLIGIAMARSFWLEESMSGNVREKARAFNAAQTALQYAESWLQSHAGTAALTCGSAAGALDAIKICMDDPSSQLDVPLKTRIVYAPAATLFSVGSGGAGGSNTYYANPGFHIRYLYSTPDNSANYYRVTAYGYGGNKFSVAVVQSLYQIDFSTNVSGTKVKNLGGL